MVGTSFLIVLAILLLFFIMSGLSVINVSYSQNYLSKLEELLNQSYQTDPLAGLKDIVPGLNMLPYENSLFGLEMQYPPDWLKTEYGSVSVEFLPPTKGNDTENYVGLWVYILPNGPSTSYLSLEDLVPQVLEEHKKTFTNFQLIKHNSTATLGGSPANILIFTYSNSTIGPVKVMEVIANKDSLTYVVKYIATSSTFPNYLATVQKIIESVKIGDSKIHI